MSSPHPVPVIAEVLEDLAKRFEARAAKYKVSAKSDFGSALYWSIFTLIAEEIREVKKELK